MQNAGRSLSVGLFFCALTLAVQARAFSTGISSLSFNSLGCNQCHTGGQPPTVTLSGPTMVAPSAANEYTLQISVAGAQNKGGLNVSAADGVLAVGGAASASTRTIAGTGGRTEITHMSPKMSAAGFIAFSFLWTAPATDGTVTLEGWGNAVDGSATSSGDKADLATLEVTVSSGPTPTATPACEPTPLPDCRKPIASAKSSFQVKDNVNDAKDALTWKWTKGTETQLSEFGDPVNGSTTYLACVYDMTGGAPALAMELIAPPGGTCAGKACWTAKKTGFLYKDKDLTNDGLMQLQLTAGAAGKAKILVKGKGVNLPVPAPVGPGLFAQDSSVIVQLVNSDGLCWDADFSTPAKKNDTTQFNDKSD